MTNNGKNHRRLLAAHPDARFTLDRQGIVLTANAAALLLTDVARDDLVGTVFFAFFTAPEEVWEAYQALLVKGTVRYLSFTLRHRTGTLTEVVLDGSVHRHAQDGVQGAELVVWEATEPNWATELRRGAEELAFQHHARAQLTNELRRANAALAVQSTEKKKRAAELRLANKELAYQNNEKEKRAAELFIANLELRFQNEEKEKRAQELLVANNELAFQNEEKEKRAQELILANLELLFQNEEKEKRAQELVLANVELAFQNDEKVKRAAELHLAKYARSLIEASCDPLMTISPEGKITDLNLATVSITGLDRETLVGSDFFAYFTDPQLARAVYQEVFAKGTGANLPLTLRHRDGQLTEVLFNGAVYKNDQGTVLGVVVVAHDVTDQHRIATELNDARLAAERATVRAEEAQAKAEGAAAIAEDATRAKQQFLSTMSHEIRTPMNAIIGFTKVLRKTELTTKQQQYLTAIKLSGDTLLVLINDILDLAKAEAGKMTFEQVPFQLADSVAAMMHLFEPKTQEKNLVMGLHYDANIPDVLVGDAVRLHQIMLNLLSNAVKFTSAGTIAVGVRLLEQDAGHVRLEFAVTDTGIGIEENKLGAVFNDFQQATSSTNRLYGGTGLGLAIVKNLVELQGGTLHVKSQPGAGSTFSFRLSFTKTTEQVAVAAVPTIGREMGFQDVRILVVEDIDLNQLLITTLLEDFGFALDVAGNGQIALEMLRTTRYDVVLMDLQMPVMNGFEATAYIRNELRSDVPIIALTADVTLVDVAKCQALGMNDYLSKPVDDQLLYRKISAFLKRADAPKAVPIPAPGVRPPACVDFHYLQRVFKTDALLAKMIGLCLQQIPKQVQAMKTAIAHQDWGVLQLAAHTLLPTFTTLGMGQESKRMTTSIHRIAVNQLAAGEKASPEAMTKLLSLFSAVDAVCAVATQELADKLLTL
ncbi:response regulator [Hymenobacter sp. BT683]|uniref:histidine kinase n=1 Tax=Hymenobacter jeongseonensis TaxID=2791027 RepID=A0ABS0INS5_9BACT|nr:ATP-binding protein [Hymenobacter jeongseonensis]MBF9239998.1 response regulator [Hymenobacter jeongseonensis]